ncbi:MAG: fibronectin type III domain-containing protein [Ruminococcaceae bacterium]|nr:fibronectin type III domain-containing protein [Oscillospiraceae bacterium]
MKRAVFSFIIALLLVVSYPSVSGLNGTDGFYFTDNTVTDNGSFSSVISFCCDYRISYLELILSFPEGISLRSYDYYEETESFCELTYENNKYRFIFSSQECVDFSKKKELIRLFMRADEGVSDGVYTVKAESIKAVGAGDTVYRPAFSGGRIELRRKSLLPGSDNCNHSFDGWTVIKAPDYDNAGKRIKKCTVCGKVCKTLDIPAVPRRNISDADITLVKSYTYTGKKITPRITLSYKGIVLEEGEDYTLSLKNNKSAGKGKITVRGVGAYEGRTGLEFTVKPRASSITEVKTLKGGKVRLRWKRIAECDGYQVYVKGPGDSKYKLLKTVKGSNKTAYTTDKLKTDGKYRFKIRSYVSDGGKKIFSSYSKIKVFRL